MANSTKRYTDKRVNRSDKYQYLIVEILLSNDAWGFFSEAQEKCLPLSDEKKEILLDWDHDLQDHLHNMIEQCLTKRQREILLMYSNGMTQMEIADKLGVNQSSITKSLNGNTDYSKGHKVYGGLKKKFVKLIKYNVEIRPIMKKIHLIWEPNSIRLPHYQTFRNLLGNEDEYEKWLDETPEQIKNNLANYQGRRINFSPEQILQMKEKHSRGQSIRDLAREFHTSVPRIKKYLESA